MKTSWRRLEDVLSTFLQDVLKTFWRRLEDALARLLENVLKMSWKRLKDVLKTFCKTLDDVLKTYDQDEYIGLDQDVFVPCCSAKKVILQVSQNSQESIKKEAPAQIFSCEFCKISHNIFFKELFGQLLLHKHSFCLLSHHNFPPFQKQRHTYFRAEYFFGLI